MLNKVAISRFWLGESRGEEKLPPIFLSLKKCTGTYNLASNEPPAGLLGPLVRYDHHWAKNK